MNTQEAVVPTPLTLHLTACLISSLEPRLVTRYSWPKVIVLVTVEPSRLLLAKSGCGSSQGRNLAMIKGSARQESKTESP